MRLGDSVALTDVEARLHFVSWYNQPGFSETNAHGFENTTFSLDLDDDPIAEGCHLGPCFSLNLNLDRLEQRQLGGLRDIALEFWTMCSSVCGLCSGLGDVASVTETLLGRYYSSSVAINWLQFQRNLASLLWIQSGDKRSRMARGVFWCNVFGQEMLQELGGDEFLEAYRATEDRRDSRLVHVLPDDSAVLLLSRSPTDLRYPFNDMLPSVLERAAWLYEQLASRRMMCGWSSSEG